MALLLAMYQKFRLIREKNELVLKQASYSSKLNRIEKNIERTQKLYTSRIEKLKQDATSFQNNASIFFKNMVGMGANSVDPYNYSGINGFVSNAMAQMLLGQGVTIGQNSDGSPITKGLDQNTFQSIMNQYCTCGPLAAYKDADGKNRYGNKDGFNCSEEEYQIFMQAKNIATQNQSMIQRQANEASVQYSNNVSIWLEAQLAEVEAEQDAALGALNYEQTMMELSKTQADSRLKRIQTELENYEQLPSQEAEKSAPTFGLR